MMDQEHWWGWQVENLETENLVKNRPFQIGTAEEEKSLLKTTGVVHSAV